MSGVVERMLVILALALTSGVVSETCIDASACDACGIAPKFTGCKEVADQCELDVCETLCLQTSWSCEVKATGCSGWDGCSQFEEQVKSPAVSHALCSQFKAATCGHDFDFSMKCCSNDMEFDVKQWAESRAYAGMFPNMPIPVGACLHDPSDKDEWKGCDACKSSISVELEALEARWPDPPSYDKEGKQTPSKGVSEKAFKNSMLPPDVELSTKFRNMQYKHTAFAKSFDSKKGTLQGKFKDAACVCLGCCPPEGQGGLEASSDATCYYPISAFSGLDLWGT
eukprot:g1093.t1